MNLKKFNIIALFIVFLFNISSVGAAFVANAKDIEITAAVKAKLLQAHDVPVKDISVETKDGVVELKGVVDTSLQFNHVVEQVAGMSNVNDVVTKDLKVKDSKAPLADSIITIKAKAKITALSIDNKISAANNLHVETTNQKIHVEGTVGNKNDIEVIKKSLLNIKDAKSVETNIEVK